MFVFFVLSTVLCLSENLVAGEHLQKFDSYTKDDGLLHSYILKIFQDREGFIWIGSYGGLNRFDGNTMISFTRKQYKGLTSDIIHEIYEPKNTTGNILWLGTDAGLIRFEKETNTFFHYGQLKSPVFSIAEDNNGNLWLGTQSRGLMKFNPDSGTFRNTALPNYINCIFFEQPDILWIGTPKAGLVKYSCSSDTYKQFFSHLSSEDFISQNNITCLYNQGNDLIVGTWGGGTHFFDKKNEHFFVRNFKLANSQPIHKIVTGIVRDNNGELWFSTYGGGLYNLRTEDILPNKEIKYKLKNYRAELNHINSLCSNILSGLYKDRSGNIWIGSSGGGISKIDFYKHRFKHYCIGLPNGKQADDSNIRAICEDKNGNIWYGTRNSGVYVYGTENEKYRNIIFSKTDKNDPRNVIRQIYRDKYDRMWVGTDYGLYMFTGYSHPDRYYKPGNNNHLPSSSILAICLDQDDNLWISANGLGVYKLTAEELNKSNTEDAIFKAYKLTGSDPLSISSNVVWSIYEDSDHNLWFATAGGLDVYDRTKDGFTLALGNNISYILEPKSFNNYLWVGSYGNGIYLMDKNNFSFIQFDMGKGLCNNNINGILEDKRGNIWISTGKGVARISTEGLYSSDQQYPAPENIYTANRIKNYSKSDGLQGHEFNLNASEPLKDGNLAFGGPWGINIFNPMNILENTFVMPVIITDFRIFNKSVKNDTSFNASPIEYLKEIKLSHRQNYFSIDFTEICFTSPEKVVYGYMLEGFDNDWVPTGAKRNSATYTGLKHGIYTFKVRAANADGYWGDQVAKLKITIRAAFWQTLLFKIFVVALGVFLLILIIVKQAKYQFQKRNKALEQQKGQFEKEKLKNNLEHKTQELASTTMYLVKRNEKLIEIKNMLIEAKEQSQSKDKTKLKEIIHKIETILQNQDNWENFELNFNLIHNNFIKRLADTYPLLTHTDIKICAFMRMNLSSKEIAQLLNIAQKSLETSRIRIRKKMNLDSSVFLSNFLLRF